MTLRWMGICGLGLTLFLGCKPAEPPHPPIAANVAPAVPLDEGQEAPELSRVAAPPTLIAVARVELQQWTNSTGELGALLKSWRDWLPPQARRLSQLVPNDTTVEAAVAVDFASGEPEPKLAMSVGLTSLSDALDVLGEEARRVGPGVYRLENDRCVVAAARGRHSARIVCSPDGLKELELYMTRGLPEEPLSGPALLQLEVRVKENVQRYTGMISQLRSLAMAGARTIETNDPAVDDPLGRIILGAADEVLALSQDLDRLALVISRPSDKAGLEVRLSTHFNGTRSWSASQVARLASATAAPPPLFWALPADATQASYSTHGSAESRQALTRALTELVDGGFQHLKVPSATRTHAVDLLRKLLTFDKAVAQAAGTFGGGGSLRATQAVGAGSSARQSKGAAKPAPPPDALAKQWWLALVDDRAANVTPFFTDANRLYADVTGKAFKTLRTGSNPLLTDDVTKKLPRLARKATGPLARLPGAVAYELVFPADVLEGLFPRRSVFAIVPAGEQTWVGFAVDEKALAQKISDLLGKTPATLAGRSDLGFMRQSLGFSAGFFSLAAILESSSVQRAQALEGPCSSVGRLLDIVSRAPQRGAMPLGFVQRSDGGPTLTWSFSIPDAALADIAFVARQTKDIVDPQCASEPDSEK